MRFSICLAVAALPMLTRAGHWTPISNPATTTPLAVIRCPSGLLALTLAGPERSEDGGTTWTPSTTGLSGNGYLSNADARGDTVVAYGMATIWRSPDAGRNWQKWDEGYVAPSVPVPWLDVLWGDTTVLVATESYASARIWKRTPHSSWTLTQAPSDAETTIGWTGSFFLGEASGGAITLDPPVTSWQTIGAGFPPSLSTPVFLSGRTWTMQDGDALLSSPDSGGTWDTAGTISGGAWTLYGACGRLFLLGDDSIWRFDPSGTANPSAVDFPGRYPESVVDLGDSCLVLSGDGAFVSRDSGSTWKRVSWKSGGGTLQSLVPSSGGWIAQDAAVADSNWFSPDLSSWTPTSLPLGLQNGGLDTAGGSTFAFTYDSLYRLDRGSWTPETVDLGSIDGPVPTLASDGKALWAIGDTLLYRRSLLGSTWSAKGIDTSLRHASFMRCWNGALWLGQNSWYDSLSHPLASTRDSGKSWMRPTLDAGAVFVLAPTSNALWVGTDRGLFRSADGQVFDRVVADPSLERALVPDLAARGDTVLATFLSDAFWIPSNRTTRTGLSFDGGKTWQFDPDSGALASAFAIAPDGIYGCLWGRGIQRWTSETEGVRPNRPLGSGLRFVSGRVAWEAEDVSSLDLLDPSGRMILHHPVASGESSVAIPSGNGLRVARLHRPEGTSTLLIPALR